MQEPPDESGSQANPSGLRPSASGLLQAGVAAVGALVVVVYPIGYSLLVARLAITYTHSLPAAWYAASLVPAPNVLGQLFGVPFLVTVVVTAAFILLDQLLRAISSAEDYRTRSVLVNGLLAATAGVVIFFLPQFGIAAIAGQTIAIATDLLRGVKVPIVVRWAALAGVAYLVVTLLTLIPTQTPNVLPQVDLTGYQVTGALLLAHTDGYWYVLTPDGVLHAVPDSEAGQATIRP